MSDQPREIAQRFIKRARARSRDDLQFLKNLNHAMLVSLIELAGKHKRLEEHVAALKRAGARALLDAYRGVYREADQYVRGELVTHGGGLWFCLVDTASRPGSGSHWVLAVKAGKQCR